MIARRGLVAFGLVLAVGLVALLVAATVPRPSRAFSLDVPNVGPVTSLAAGHRACESPIEDPSAFGGVRVWAASVGEPGILHVTVGDAGGARTLASGYAPVSVAEQPVTATVGATIPAHRQLRVCWTDIGPAAVDLFGSAPVQPSVRLTADGKPVAAGLALVMLTPHSRSLLSQLSTVFSRAALFRPSWVGSWTFWVLLGGVIVALGLGGFAVALATDDEP